MANDIDMWNDIEYFEKHNQWKKAELLLLAYTARYEEGNIKEAERLKEVYEKKYKQWGNYY